MENSNSEWSNFRGAGQPALVTPFLDGIVEHETLARIVEWQISEGSHALVVVGATGESPTLSAIEQQAVITTAVKAAKGRVPVIAGTGSNNTAEAITYLQAAEKAGASGALIVTPYYNRPTLQGIVEHFKVLHDNTNLPIILYNIPGRSVVDITPEAMGELAKLSRIVGVKDATGRVERVSLQHIECGESFVQLSGEDATSVAFNAQGGRGCISVTANVAPRLCANLQNACLIGDYKTALAIHNRLMPLHKALFMEPGLVGAKYVSIRIEQ